METLIISLPSELKKFLDEQIAKGQFKSHSDYVEKMLTEDKHAREMEKFPNDFPFDPNLLSVFSTEGIK